jgi:hypothetical protein
MAITKAQYISDIKLMLNQGEISDDSSLHDAQIAFWGTNILNELVTTEINSKIARGEMIPAVYIQKESFAELEEEDATVGDDRVFVELADEVLTLNNGLGVIKVEDEDGNEIKKADVQSLSLFKNMRFAKPSSENVLYSHEGPNKIYLPGLKPVDVPFDGVIVYYVPKQDIETMSDSDEILVSDLVLPELMAAVAAKGREMLLGSTPDQENQGTDVKQEIYHQQIKK